MSNKNRTRTYTEKPKLRRHDGSLRKRRKPTLFSNKKTQASVFTLPEYYIRLGIAIILFGVVYVLIFDGTYVDAAIQAAVYLPMMALTQYYYTQWKRK